MIAVDTNLLVYAHRADSPHHEAARAALRGLVETGRPWAIPWPCAHEFLAIVTHRRIYVPPTPPTEAVAALRALLGTPVVHTLAETPAHAAILGDLIAAAGVAGGMVHDARIAAICLGHEVDVLWTADRDLSAFPALSTRNPLVGA